jgi:enamine deaminase RidA (YjgF/YER057c/UK114 family)
VSPYGTSRADERAVVTDESAIERFAGYSRAVRVGNLIAVSGTTANTVDDTAQHVGDTYTQATAALRHAVAAAVALGAERSSILRSRLLLDPTADWEAACLAHREVLGDVAPANAMYFIHSLVGDGFLVEVEIDAVAVATSADRSEAAV